MRRHHEESAALPALAAAVTTVIPIGVAIWIRVKEWLHNYPANGKRDEL
jgi:hypothetical protein